MAVTWKRLAYTSQIRELLTADRTYYVRTDGHDTASGLNNTTDATTGAFLTGQHAYDVITGTLDLGGNTVTVQFEDGTYTDPIYIEGPWIGGGEVKFKGDEVNPDNVIINNDIPLGIYCNLPGYVWFTGFKINGELQHWGVGFVRAGYINSAGASSDVFQVGTPGAVIDVFADCEISDDCGCFAASISPGAYVYLDAYFLGAWTLTLTGTPDFSTAFARAQTLGHIYSSGSGITFSGSATGSRYALLENSVIATEGGGANYFPGDSAGTNDGTGVYT